MNRKPKIMFVDDDVNVLDAMRNRLRKDRQRWDLAFATGGEAALSEMEASPADVIISDMQMPGMDGATLLRAVRDRSPSTIRLILSGHAEEEALMRALPVAHAFLRKPCETEHLRALIDGICLQRSLMPHQGLRSAAGVITALGVPGPALRALLEITAHPPHGRSALIALLGEEPVLAAKVLHLANSGYLGPHATIVGLEDAVAFAGVAAIGAFARSEAVFGVAEASTPEAAEFRCEAADVARIAAKLTRVGEDQKAAYAAGLLHDLGHVLIAERFPEARREIVGLIRENKVPCCEAEILVLGVTHADVAAYMLGVWGLSPAITEAVRHHHRPLRAPEYAAETAAAVHVADAITKYARAQDSPSLSVFIDDAFLKEKARERSLPDWEALAGEERRRREQLAHLGTFGAHAGESQ